MIFDVSAEGPDGARAHYVKAVLINGVDIATRCFYVDTETDCVGWLLLNDRGQQYIAHSLECARRRESWPPPWPCDEACDIAKEFVTVKPSQLRVIRRDDCPPELRW